MNNFDIMSKLPLIVIIVFLIILIILLTVDRSNILDLNDKHDELKNKQDTLKDKINDLKMECPACPVTNCPTCPQVNCPEMKCPEMNCPVCPENKVCPQCPQCPAPPHCPSVDEIVGGIFPGRNTGITSGGKYFNIQANDSYELLPDYDFYQYKLSEVLNNDKLIIVFFLSPNFCKTATCFPQLDVLKNLKSKYHDKITFIHVEVYENPHLIKGNLNNAKISSVLNEWNIKSEPYTFLIDKNNYLFRKFQGYVSFEEIENYIVNLLNE